MAIVHIGKREKSGLQILEKLKQHDFPISQWDIIDSDIKFIDLQDVDVIVVNIGLVEFEYDDLLSKLFDSDIKIIINEAILTNELSGVKRQSWERHLLNKIDSTFSILPETSRASILKRKKVNFISKNIQETWVLAASIGGPEAISEFLSVFSDETKYLFIIVQHIDKEFLSMLAQKLNSTSKIPVKVPVSGMKIKKSICIIYPTDEHLEFNENGILELVAMNETYNFTPCIDKACKMMANNLAELNIAVFSGMSTDGVIGAYTIRENGGKVITQSESSCVLSSIVEGVKKNLEIDFSGTPTEMATFIVQSTKNRIKNSSFKETNYTC